jgi:GTP-binding protein EngB required for normal cell division
MITGPMINGEPAAWMGSGGGGLSGRLTALARLVQIGGARTGQNGFDRDLLRDAEQLVARAGERLRLSANHTVAILAGGTGSGKSSLFNRLAGADFSPVGVTRPVTLEPHACVWGMEGAGPLLEWLGVKHRYRYGRSSALGEGERSLRGLVLLDVPDHDSVLGGTSEVSRLVALADLMIWVLDPQKYADAAVHSRFLTPMAGHSSVMTVVLNQSDLLTTAQAEDCVSDLRRLLDSEGLQDARVHLTSARTGAGLDELRKLLVETVSARRAASERIGADLDAMIERFLPYAGGAGMAGPPGDAEDFSDLPPPRGAELLAEAFAGAAGASGVGQALQSARELKAVDYVGWPVAWIVDRVIGRDPVRKLRLGNLWDELRAVSAGPAGAQQAEIDNALTAMGDQVGTALPQPWAHTVRAAARSRAQQIPAALGAAIGESLPAENTVTPWWRLVAAWQGLLLGCAVIGLAWMAAIIVLGVSGMAPHAPAIFRDLVLLPWIAVMIAAILVLGWLTASACVNRVTAEALREREQVDSEMRSRMTDVAEQMVLLPIRQELSECSRFCAAVREAGQQGAAVDFR